MVTVGPPDVSARWLLVVTSLIEEPAEEGVSLVSCHSAYDSSGDGSIGLLPALGGLDFHGGPGPSGTTGNGSGGRDDVSQGQGVEALRRAGELAASREAQLVLPDSGNLKGMDDLDFAGWNNADWHGVFAQHRTDDVLVDWKGQAPTHGIDQHIDAMKAYVESAGGTPPQITSHPIAFGSGAWTCVVGEFEGGGRMVTVAK
jgi:hypothetical protein